MLKKTVGVLRRVDVKSSKQEGVKAKGQRLRAFILSNGVEI
jgi:hypothetical protein